jgi:hypothetical protein
MLSLEEAVRRWARSSPAGSDLFDTHNAVDEVEPHPTLVDRYFDYIRPSISTRRTAAIPAPATTISSPI